MSAVPDATRERIRRATTQGGSYVDNVKWKAAFLEDYPDAEIGFGRGGFYGRFLGAAVVTNFDLGRVMWAMEKLAMAGSPGQQGER